MAFGFFFTNIEAQETGALSKSDMVKLDYFTLTESKVKIQNNDPDYIPAYKQLLKDANKALKFQPVSVMDKTATPPSGDKHDYMSIAPYWWPNPNKASGLPYIRKDGLINPEVKDYPDKENMPKLCESIYILSLAYYFSENEKYAEHAAELIKVWFLNEDTKMNPNLNFGQAIKGVTDGRAEGMIDTRHFIFVIDGVELLKVSPYWTDSNHEDLKKWFSSFIKWMNESPIAQDEFEAKNNHGVWFDAQQLSYALFIDDLKLAKKIIETSISRIDKQMSKEGSFPLELERTTSLHYSTFIMNAFVIIGQLSDQLGVDLWNYKTKSGKSLKLAYDFLLPYITKEKVWTSPQIKPFNFSDAFPILLRGKYVYDCNSCIEAIKINYPGRFEKFNINLL
jgi:Alginate lyase